jgi:predicted O-methyltransferase YrrM
MLHEHIHSTAPDASHPEAYTAPAPQAAETELADFLWGLVRLTHPDNVLETGAYQGDTTQRLVDAVLANGHGLVTTVEIDPRKAERVTQRLAGQPARVLVGSFDEVNLAPPAGRYGVAFFDSHWERDVEYRAAQPFLAAGAILVFHDCGPQHKRGMVRHRVDSLEAEGLIRGFYVPTPRGVVVARRA